MAKLYFKIASDWQEVVRLRDEIKKLETQLLSMDKSKSPAALAAMQTQLASSRQRMTEMVTEAAKAGAVMENDFKRKIFEASQVVNDFSQKIITQKGVVKDVEADVKRLGEAYRTALKKNPASASSLHGEYNAARRALDEEKAALFGLTQQQAEARLSVKRLRDEYALLNDESKSVQSSTDGIGVSLKKAFAVLGGATFAKGFIEQMIRVRGEFQQADTAIATLLQSEEKAAELMGKIRERAKLSPLEFSAFTQATQMMLGFNIEAEKIPRYLQAIDDVAMGDSGRFNSLTLAFSQMSAAGKLMGQDLNQMINAGFNPLQIIADKTGKSISQLKEEMSRGAISAEMVQQAFIDATSAGGRFYQMSEKGAKTINGQISMMHDAMNAMFNELGQQSEGIIMEGIQASTALIENYETVGKVLIGLIATYGTYRAAVITNIALTRSWAVASRADSVAKGIQTAATWAATAAQTALNTAMKANPYVLAATALVALGTAMWAFSDSTTAAEAEQKRLDERTKQHTDSLEEERKKIDELVSVLKDETSAKEDRIEAFNKLKQMEPQIFSMYKTETELVNHLAESIAKLNDEYRQRNNLQNVKDVREDQTRLQELRELQRLERVGRTGRIRQGTEWRYGELYEKYKINELSGWTDAGKIQSLIDATAKTVASGQNKLREQAQTSFEASLEEMSDSQATSLKNYYERSLQALRQSGKRWINIGKEDAPVDEATLKKRIALLNTSILSVEKKSAEQYRNEAKAEWEKAQKEVEKIKTGETTYRSQEKYLEALKKAEEAEKKAKSAYESLGGETKQDKKEESARLKADIRAKKNADERKKLLASLELQVAQAHIDAMQDGFEKEQAQRQLNHRKELEEIERQRQDYLQRKISEARSIFEADPKNKNKRFDESSVSLTDSEEKFFEDWIKYANQKHLNMYDGLVEKYQSYTDQRLSIEKQFNTDISLLEKAREEAMDSGNQKEVERLNRAIAKATSERGKALMQHDFNVLKESPEYIRAFEDLRNTSTETLASLLSQFEQAKEAAAQLLNPDEFRQIADIIQSVMDELDRRNPFKALVNAYKNMREANDTLQKAKSDLITVNNGGKIISSYKLGEDGKIVPVYLSAADALKKYTEAKDNAAKANNKFLSAEAKAKKEVDQLANSIKDIGNIIGGESGEIISLIGDVTLFATSSIEGISKVSKTGAEALSSLEKASVILGIISTAIQLIQKIGELGSNKQFKEYQAYAEKIKEINKLTDAVNNYRIAALEAQQAEKKWFSSDNLQNLRDLKDVHDEVFKAYVDKAGETQAIYQNERGGGWLTGAVNWVMGNLSLFSPFEGWRDLWGQGNYDKGTTAAINNLRIETRKKDNGFLGSGIGAKSQRTEDLVSWAKNNDLGNLFDEEGFINKDLAQTILKEYGDKLVGQTKETLEALIGLREKYDEYIQSLHEYVSSLYQPLVDNFVDSIWDWFDEGKDALDSFKNYAAKTFREIVSDMIRTIVMKNVVKNFSNDIASVYEQYAKGTINEKELMNQVANQTGDLIERYKQNLPVIEDLVNSVNNSLNTVGIDLHEHNGSAQSSSGKGFQTMSQDTGSELNGRFTALQEYGAIIKDQNIAQTTAITELKGSILTLLNQNPDVKNIADEIRSLIVNSYLELVAIRENTGAIIKPIKMMQEDIAEVKRNTSRL